MESEIQSVRKSLSTEEKSLAMAITILTDRVRRLSDDDAEDAFQLFLCLSKSKTKEERAAADSAMWELLSNEQVTVHEAQLPDPDQPPADENEDFSKWKKYVSEKIQRCRTDADLTQVELAEKTGLPQSHLSRIENGRLSPSHTTLEKIAKALGIPVVELDPSA